MSDDFLNTDFLENEKKEDFDFTSFIKNSKFTLKKDDFGKFLFFIEYENSRINSFEIDKILSSKNNLSQAQKSLLEYLNTLFGKIQTILKPQKREIETIFLKCFDTNFNFFLEDTKVSFSKENLKLDINIKLDENSNVIIEFLKDYNFIFGEEKVFLVVENKIILLEKKLPTSFLEEVYTKKSKLPILKYIDIRKSLIEKLDTENLLIDDKLKKIIENDIVEKVSSVVLKIENSEFFITGELYYKILGEYFKIKDYRYEDTQNSFEKPIEIKTILENEKLVTYTSDLTISQFILDDIFYELKINCIDLDRNPFLFKIPIGQLEMFSRDVLPILKNKFEVEFKEGSEMRVKREKVSFLVDSNLKKSLNLFEFNVKFKIGSKEFSITEIKELISMGKRSIKMDDGTTITIDNVRDLYKWLEFLKRFDFKSTNQKYTSQGLTSLELDEFLKSFENTKVLSNDEYKQIIKESNSKKPIEEIELPKLKKYEFRNYQRDGIFWLEFLKKYNFGGILADEMGLGKTLQTLSVLNMNNTKPHIVVCPKSLIFNWENEVKKYFPKIKTLVISQASKKREELIKNSKGYNILITSYSMLQKDYKVYDECNIEFDYMVLDEAHYIKNMKTLSSKAVKTLNTNRKIILTGTPLENKLEELYGLFDIIMPNYLGKYNEFRRDFSSKIERNDKVSLEILRSKIRPFILRRTKEEVLKELPKKQEQIVFNEMTNKQKVVYNEILNRVKEETDRIIESDGRSGKSRIQILSALLRLRQACNHPRLIDSSFEDDDMSAKVEQFEELLLETIESDEKVLVFSQFTKMLDILEKKLINNNILYERLDGTTKDREKVVNNFNENKKIRVFLISLKAGGVGLNLTSASNVFIYDPWWNPQVENQAIDRAHRIGQKKTVNVYKFITKNSIEEKILKLQERKADLFENIVKDDSSFIKNLEWEDLLELFE